jgi:hypothetical protein
VMLEKNRMELFREVQTFLDEGAGKNEMTARIVEQK